MSSPDSAAPACPDAPAATGNLLDLEDPAKLLLTSSENPTHLDNSMFGPSSSVNNNVVWEMDDDLDEAFSRLAQSRTNPYVLDTGLTAQDIQSAEMLSSVDWNKIDSNTGEKDDLFMF